MLMSASAAPLPVVYRHSSKPEWGLAVVAWELDGRRGYQFEDGALRVFKDGYYHHLEEVDTPADRLDSLSSMLRESTAPRTGAPPASTARGVALDEQIDFFLLTYPDGFHGAAWRADHRIGKSSSRKRHRDPVIAAAQLELAQPAVDAHLDEHREHQGLSALFDVIARTDLVPTRQVRPLTALRGDVARAVLRSVRELLWDTAEPLPRRFTRWVNALAVAVGNGPSWELATAPLALVHPLEHVCVRSARFQSQAAWMAPNLRLAAPPTAATYERTLAMAQRIRQRLAERGAPAVDLLDVHDFVELTRAPKACADIAARRALRND